MPQTDPTDSAVAPDDAAAPHDADAASGVLPDMVGVPLTPAAVHELVHPVRMRVWQALVYEGPGTATTIGERIGESSGSASYHLRRLAELGFIREASQLGTGRERWWESVPGSFSINPTTQQDEVTRSELSAAALSWVQLRHERYLTFLSRAIDPSHEGEPWMEASTDVSSAMLLSLEELREFSSDADALMTKWARISRANKAAGLPGGRTVDASIRAFVTDSEATA